MRIIIFALLSVFFSSVNAQVQQREVMQDAAGTRFPVQILQLRPDIMCSGAGTQANPFVHPDSTCGIQTLINSVPDNSGADIYILPGKEYRISKHIDINKRHIRIYGGNGFNIDPNGEGRGIGCGLYFTNYNDCGFKIGNNSYRLGGIVIEGIYAWGPGISVPGGGSAYANGNAFITIVGQGCDQARFQNFTVGFFCKMIDIVSGNLDTPYILFTSILNGGYGIVARGTPCYFMHITDNCWADLDHQAVLLNSGPVSYSNGDEQATISNNTFVRAARLRTDEFDAAVYLNSGFRHIIANNVIRETGRNSLFDAGIAGSTPSNTLAHGIIIASPNCIVQGNQINSNVVGTGLIIRAKGTLITGNKFAPVADDANKIGSQANKTDIVIESTASETVLNGNGPVNMTDNGSTTAKDNLSSNQGDPNATGAWLGKPKWDGLHILDKVTSLLYLYGSTFSTGRIALSYAQPSPLVGSEIVFPAGSSFRMQADPITPYKYIQQNQTFPDGWTAYSVATQFLAANTEGRIWAKIANSTSTDGHNCSLFFSGNVTGNSWETDTDSWGIIGNSNGDLYYTRNGTATLISGQQSTGDSYFAVHRLANGTVQIERSTDQLAWTTIYTFAPTTTTKLYIKTTLLTSGATEPQRGTLYLAQGTGITQ